MGGFGRAAAQHAAGGREIAAARASADQHHAADHGDQQLHQSALLPGLGSVAHMPVLCLVLVMVTRSVQMRSAARRSEEHTSELQSLMRISYAVFCLKKKTIDKQINQKSTKANTKSQHGIRKHTSPIETN